MNWNPVLSPSDFGTRKDKSHLTYALEQRHNVEAGTLAEDIKEEIAKVQAADLVVFTFPLFWFSIPAILKGWIDRVFVSGLFYGGKTVYSRAGRSEEHTSELQSLMRLSYACFCLKKKKKY